MSATETYKQPQLPDLLQKQISDLAEKYSKENPKQPDIKAQQNPDFVKFVGQLTDFL